MGKNIARRHHYVPQLLLRGFTDAEGRLWAYDTERGAKYDCAPSTAAVERDFYAVGDGGTELELTHIENFLQAKIDGPGAGAIEAILRREPLGAERAMNFMGFAAAQMLRTPAFFDRLIATFAPSMQETCERIAKFEPEFRQNLTERMAKDGARPAEISELMELLEAGKFKVSPSRDFILQNAMRQIQEVAVELSRMRWIFADLDEADPDLIIGDHPVMLADVGDDGSPPGPLGIQNPNIELVLPLSRRVAAMAHWDGPIAYARLAAGMAQRFNERTLRHARRFVFASVDSRELLEGAVRLRGTGPQVRIRRLRVGDGFVIHHQYR